MPVEIVSRKIKTGLHVMIVIHKKDGVTIQDCTEVHKAVLPRIEIETDYRDINLQVASPGVYRNLKSAHEFDIFKGTTVRILESDEPDWIFGVIVSADDTGVVLQLEDGDRTIPFTRISKARLDFP